MVAKGEGGLFRNVTIDLLEGDISWKDMRGEGTLSVGQQQPTTSVIKETAQQTHTHTRTHTLLSMTIVFFNLSFFLFFPLVLFSLVFRFCQWDPLLSKGDPNWQLQRRVSPTHRQQQRQAVAE